MASREPDALQEHPRTPLRGRRLQGCGQFLGGTLGHFLERDLLLGVEIAFEDVEENGLADVQADASPAVDAERRLLDRLRHLARCQTIDAAQRPPHAILRLAPTKTRAKGDNRPEVVVQGRLLDLLFVGGQSGSPRASRKEDENSSSESGQLREDWGHGEHRSTDHCVDYKSSRQTRAPVLGRA